MSEIVKDDTYAALKEAISRKMASVAVVGLGYVGFPLAMELARAGFKVFGTDTNRDRREAAGREAKDLITVGPSLADAGQPDVILITVPTPLTKQHEPDLSHVIAAAQEVAGQLRRGQLIILESTSYPGTTEEVLAPSLTKSGFRIGHDIFVAYSPERVDPGNARYNIRNTPKLVGGVTERCAEAAALVYQQIAGSVVVLSSTRAAEMTKLLENVFRSVNVALVNELALLCDRMGIDVWEVVQAAATKPFGFMSFSPGPGLGGHCIPIDPFYLSWKAREYDFDTKFIELAGRTNESMPAYVLDKVARALTGQGKNIHGAKILVLGVAYKKDIADVREAPALKIIELVEEKSGSITYYDPSVAALTLNGKTYRSVPLTEEVIADADAVIIVTDHSDVDYAFVAKHAALIMDTRNVLADIHSDRVIRL